MRRTKSVNFDCPKSMLDRVDEIARAEFLSRADVLRRAIYWELKAHGVDPREVCSPAVSA